MPKPLVASSSVHADASSQSKAAPGPAGGASPGGKRTEHHDTWLAHLAGLLKHDVTPLFAGPGLGRAAQVVERGGHNALAGAETALVDMKSGVTKVAGHVLRKDMSKSLAGDDKRRARIAAGADKNSLAFKAGNIATHVVVDTAATIAVAAGGEVVLGAAGVGAGVTGLATAAGLEGAAAQVAGRLAVGAAANAVGSGAVTGLEGGHAKEVLKAAAVGGLSVGVGHAVGEVVNPALHALTRAAPKVAQRVARAGAEAASGAATGGIVSAATGDKPRDIAQDALFGGALSGMSAAVHARAAHEPAPGHPEHTQPQSHPGTAPAQPHTQPHADTPAAGSPHQGAGPDPAPHPSHTGTQARGTHDAAEPASQTAPAGQGLHAASGAPVTGSDSATDHPGVLTEESASKEHVSLWPQGLDDLGPKDVKGLAYGLSKLTPQERERYGSEPLIDTILSAEKNKEIITGPTVLKKGALPDKYHDAHAHEGPYSGTYDPTYKDADISRQIRLSQDGKRMTLNFPVAPHIFELGAAKAEGLFNEPAYYNRRRQGEHGPENVMGTAKVLANEVHVQGYGIADTAGDPKIQPAKYDRADFEKILGGPIPPGVDEIHFVSSPAHTTLSYQGPRVDEKHIEMIAKRAGETQQFLGEYPENMKGLYVGLAGSNPFDPKTYKGAYKTLDYANKAEAKYGLPPGSLKISGFGELTIAKETVGALSAMPELNPDTVRDISQATSSMRYAGGTTVIHMDASNSKVTPDLSLPGSANVNTLATQGQAENLVALKQLLKENPDQEIIWAHIGAAVTQKVPEGYTEQIRELLANHPNLKIDTSWTATADMISGRALGDPGNKPVDTANVQRWAEVIADNPDRFLWGSDTIAASQKGNVDVVQAVYNRFKEIGLLEEIKRIGDQKGSSDAIEKFLSVNFEDSIGKAADRVSRFRTDPDNIKWLAAGGPNEANGRIPPMQWIKENGEWQFVKSSDLPNGGNRETYEMPDDLEPSEGPAMIWKADGKSFYTPTPGPARDTGKFTPNPNRGR